MKTKCGHCERVFASPTSAAKHASKEHEPVGLKEQKGQPLFRVTWNRSGEIRKPRGES